MTKQQLLEVLDNMEEKFKGTPPLLQVQFVRDMLNSLTTEPIDVTFDVTQYGSGTN